MKLAQILIVYIYNKDYQSSSLYTLPSSAEKVRDHEKGLEFQIMFKFIIGSPYLIY